MRPSNLKEVASSVVKGMSRSINRSAQTFEEETREGSRKGSPTHDNVYDMLEFMDDASEVTDKYFDGYNKLFEDLSQEELSNLASDLKSRFPEEYQEYVDSVDGAYLGRKGSVDWDKFMGWESASDPNDREKFVSAFEEITGHKYDSEYGDDFENEDEARRILELLDRTGSAYSNNTRMGSRNGSRKGMDVDGYFNVVAGNHGLDIAKAIKVRDEMNEEGILPDTEEFVELSKKHGVDPEIMQNVVDDFAERYLI